MQLCTHRRKRAHVTAGADGVHPLAAQVVTIPAGAEVLLLAVAADGDVASAQPALYLQRSSDGKGAALALSFAGQAQQALNATTWLPSGLGTVVVSSLPTMSARLLLAVFVIGWPADINSSVAKPVPRPYHPHVSRCLQSLAGMLHLAESHVTRIHILHLTLNATGHSLPTLDVSNQWCNMCLQATLVRDGNRLGLWVAGAQAGGWMLQDVWCAPSRPSISYCDKGPVGTGFALPGIRYENRS
jgi:hypothetical protein